MPRRQNKKGQAGRSPSQKASSQIVPTVQPNPKRAYTVVLNDQSDDQSPFTGVITYSQILGALRYQIREHKTPALGAEAPGTVWNEPWRYLQVCWLKAWGNPYRSDDPTAGVKFSAALFAAQGGSRPPPPDKFDFGAGASDRPFAFIRGTPSHWADGGVGETKVISLQDADLIHVGVLVW